MVKSVNGKMTNIDCLTKQLYLTEYEQFNENSSLLNNHCCKEKLSREERGERINVERRQLKTALQINERETETEKGKRNERSNCFS